MAFPQPSQTRAGGHADHSHGDATFGLSNWHSLHGPILGYGPEDASNLQKWCVDNPVIPLLGHLLSAELSPDSLHGVKFLLCAFGDDSVAEVRIDGIRSDLCSGALLAFPWPKEPSRVVRFFEVFAHPL